MKKIFIYAYSKLNLGDDLFVKILCERYPDHLFYIVCRRENAHAFSNIKNLKVIYSVPYLDSLMQKLSLQQFFINRIAKKCDLIVSIGGSIFIEPEKWQEHVNKYKNRLKINKPFYIIGSNFGPYKTEQFYKEYYRIFEEVNDICFRDEYSYNLFSEIDNTRLASDVVFTLKADDIELRNEKNNFVISVINLKNRKDLAEYQKSYEEKIIEITSQLADQGHQVVLMSFCENEGDLEAIKRIYKKLSEQTRNKTKIYNYNGDLNESLSIIKSSKGIVATRFHAMILGWLFELNVFPIIYSQKTENVLIDTEFQGDSAWIQEIDQAGTSSILSQLLIENKHIIDEEIQDAQKQFLKLDEILH